MAVSYTHLDVYKRQYENYAPETIAYIEALGQINIWLAEQADTVYEVMAGQAVCWKAKDRK